MSVINQMLKDLDKRQNEQQGGVNQPVTLPSKSINGKFVFILITVVVVLNVVGVFGWQLYIENQQLKAQAQQVELTSLREQDNAIASTNVLPQAQMNTEVESLSVVKAVTALPTSETKKAEGSGENSELLPANHNKKNAKAAQDNLFSESKNISKPQLDVVSEPLQDAKDITEKSSLTISRTQLSPQALAANKISEAEQAMERNDLAKAESLFEEVLLVMPEHVTARKQLAALWYGKKYYQDAVNLLSQGIALAPQHEEMRLMSARIYYEQGLARQAFNILIAVKLSISTEIQALLANVSAELNEHEHAIFAYRKLISLESDIGRWWLGLAVSLDSIGKFVPAREAYKEAIARNNLSTSAMQFARHRLIELGE